MIILAIDFDSTLEDIDNKVIFPAIGKPNLDLIQWLTMRRKLGDKLILLTVRENHDERRLLDKAVDFCRHYGLKFDAVNENIQPNNYAWQPRKIWFDYLIDDRVIPVSTWQLYMDSIEQYKRQPLQETK